MYGDEFQRFSPVKVGDEVDVKIEAIGEKGDGIAKVSGFVVIIPNTSVNDEVRVKITKVLRRVAFAEVVGDAMESADEDPDGEEIEDAEEESEDSQDSEEPDDSQDSEDAEEEDSTDFGAELE